MINRALTRQKTVQILYAHYQNEGRELAFSLDTLDKSQEEAYELYHHLLALLTDIRDYAARRAENQEVRALRLGTYQHKASLDGVLAQNKLLLMLSQNEELTKFKECRRELWKEGDTFLKRITNLFVQSDLFERHAAYGDFSFKADQDIIRQLYRQLLAENEDLDQALEDASIFWNDDREIIDSFVLKTLKRFQSTTTPDMPLLPAYDEGEDTDFGRQLLSTAINKEEEIREMVRHHVRGWEVERMAMMDMLIMQLALAEIITFPNIPVNVTLNEYINMAKFYSTPKSASYINGVLDSVVKQLRAEGAIMK